MAESSKDTRISELQALLEPIPAEQRAPALEPAPARAIQSASSESVSQETASTQSGKWSKGFARRLSPLLFYRQWLAEKPTDGSIVPEAGGEKLSEKEVENRCFAVLGYMEEYFRSPTGISSEQESSSDATVESLEAELDAVLSGPSAKKQTPDASQSQERKRHQEVTRAKIARLLANPQVKEKFDRELKKEHSLYQAAEQSMREVRTYDRVAGKARRAIYQTYLESKKAYGKLTQSAADRIAVFQNKLSILEEAKLGVEQTASIETLGYLETQKLLSYKQQMQERGFVMTPSREKLLDRITREALAGKKIFLVGSTGTGKTELAFYALDTLTGGYEVVPWHEGTTPRDIFGYRELYEDESGKVQSGVKPGPYPRALEKGVGLVHEEFTGGSTRTQLSMKYLMGARPGETVQIPGFNGEVHEITPNFIELFTGNPKDERTKNREEMDPAILRELTGIEVGYMPASEMRDILFAKLIEENGVLRLAKSERKYIEQLCKAAEMMQKIHNRDFSEFSPEIKTLLGIDAQGNTETSLNANFLDPGTLFKLFGEWELARARGQRFNEYIQAKLTEFIQDPKTLSAPEERKTLQKVLHAFGLVAKASGEITATVRALSSEKGYVLPSEMAGISGITTQNPMELRKPERKKSELNKKLEEDEKNFWAAFLGTPGVVVPPLEIDLAPETEQQLEKMGMKIVAVPKLDIGTLEDLQWLGVDNFLEKIYKGYPELRKYEALSDREKKDARRSRLLRKEYWEEVLRGTLPFPTIFKKGGWLAVEVSPKPEIDQYFMESTVDAPLNKVFQIQDRKNISAKQADMLFQQHRKAILARAGLPDFLQIRMPHIEEWNLLGNRELWGKTDTWEWTQTLGSSKIAPSRVLTGKASEGGAGAFKQFSPELPRAGSWFRAAIPLESP